MRLIAIPVKSLDGSKRRLASVLSPLERAALTLAMLEDVLDAALGVPGCETLVLSPDEAVLELAVRRGAIGVPEERPPLTNAVRQIEQEAIDRGADTLGILVADAPLVTAEALTDSFRTLGPVVLAAGADGGTTLLLRRPPRAIGARFGKDSLARHLALAAAKDLPAAVIQRPELSFDLDVPEDIAVLLAAGRDGRTKTTLLELGAAARVPAPT
ncbi:MAG: 2-phospho-L-lactate guanylyltransferase [Actinomycetota bacterium]